MENWVNMHIARGYDLSEYEEPQKAEPNKTSPRADLLSEAINVTTGDRARDYGDTITNMNRVAAIFNAMTGRDLKGSEVAELLMALKIARMQVTREHRDSHVDLMAYAGIRYECACAERVDQADKI